MCKTIVIAGAGQAAAQLIATLKHQNFTGRVVLVGEEPHLPYHRPPLSKSFLAGKMLADRLNIKPPTFYDDPSIVTRLSTRVAEIDRRNRTVRTDSGDVIAYDTLVLALGSRVRRLPIEGEDLKGVHYLRNISDVDAIRVSGNGGKRVAIIGAGYIGLEVAAVTRQLGHDVTVIETADRVMSRVVSPEVSEFYQREHASHGVNLRLGTGVTSLGGNATVRSVTTTEGENIVIDFVIIGVGVIPNTELAEAAGLSIENGIIVNDRCQTSDADIYAIGDCTLHPNSIYDRQVRLESVHNAIEQAKTAAANISGDNSRYDQVPWFWSDQYDLKLQIAGLSQGYDEVVIRGDPADRSFACLYLKDDRLIATDAVNSPRDFVQSKALIATQARINSKILGNTRTQLRELVD